MKLLKSQAETILYNIISDMSDKEIKKRSLKYNFDLFDWMGSIDKCVIDKRIKLLKNKKVDIFNIKKKRLLIEDQKHKVENRRNIGIDKINKEIVDSFRSNPKNMSFLCKKYKMSYINMIRMLNLNGAFDI
jgi:hypothetical protein